MINIYIYIIVKLKISIIENTIFIYENYFITEIYIYQEDFMVCCIFRSKK